MEQKQNPPGDNSDQFDDEDDRPRQEAYDRVLLGIQMAARASVEISYGFAMEEKEH